jgi:hypothetical protein
LEVGVRSRLFVLGAGLLLALSGCSPQEAAAQPVLPPVQVVQPAAASAGGACILWDYALIEEHLGIRFDVAAAGQVDDTSTCVVQAEWESRPDLALSVVSRTAADAALYTADLMPAKATRLKGLGKAAYSFVGPAGADHGPVSEVGWFTGDRQIMTLRFTAAKGGTAAAAAAMTGRLLALAKALAAADS